MNRTLSLQPFTSKRWKMLAHNAWQFLFVCCGVVIGLSSLPSANAAEPPKLHDPAGRFEISLFAAAPQIVNPIGVQVDVNGRIFVIESHTHFRPKTYAGPEKDRILILEDTNADGVADKTTVFHEGFTASMDLLLGSGRTLYVAERSAIHLLSDTNDDSKADEDKVIVKLETAGNYPHNGLSGLTLDGKNGLYFGLGENLGAPYKLIGSDGATLTGEAEGGSIYHVLEDGSKLRRVATGVWNPFGICVDASGNVFATDNDPDSSPPCRLLHVVEGGDYGYEFRYGRSGLHPFQCWNGELPGTLPMLTGIGEAPCEIVPWNDGLLIASWADNRLEHYQLKPQGGSFTVKQEVLVSGDLHFRPVGIAVTKDGTLYVSDWASASYELPGTGRIWKLKPKEPPHEESPRLLKDPLEKQKSAPSGSPADCVLLLNDADPFIRNIGIQRLAAHLAKDAAFEIPADELTPLGRQAWAIACKRAGQVKILPELLKSEDAALRIIALKWIADLRLTDYRPQVEAGLRDSQLTRELFAAHLAALERLDNRKATGSLPDPSLVLPVLTAADSSPKVRALALLLLPPNHQELTTQRLRELLNISDAQLSREVVRTMLAARHAERIHLLAEVAQDEKQPVPLRAMAISGLAGSGEYQGFLLTLAQGSSTTLRDEALRALIDMPLSDTDRAKLATRKELPAAQRLLASMKPTLPANTDVAAWLKLTTGAGDAEAGERIFFHSKVGLCARCHLHSGRGNPIGPDLTRINERATREWLVIAILQPSRDVAPAFRQWHIETTDGKQFVGLSLRKGSHSEDYLGIDGQPFSVKLQQIEERRESPLSIMPDGLEQQLTPDELRDLLAFLLHKHD